MTEQTESLNERLEQAREQLREAADKLQKAVLGIANRVEQGSSEFFDSLVAAGEKLEKQKQKASKTSASKKAEPGLLESYANRLVASLGLPSSEDLQALNKKLDSRTRKVRKLEKAGA